MQFDHLFVCVPAAADAADAIKATGFTEGPANSHPGQGTANRSFFFNNGFVELLYAVDDFELQSELTRPTGLYERLSNPASEVSPYGLCFRPASAGDRGFLANALLPCWQYRPGYLPDHLAIEVADTPLAEPMWFYLSFAQRPDSLSRVSRERLQHPNGASAITGVTITVPREIVWSATAEHLSKTTEFNLLQGDEHLAVIEFDHHKQDLSYDLRPEVPLVLCW